MPQLQYVKKRDRKRENRNIVFVLFLKVSGCYGGKWSILPAGWGSGETCGHRIKRPVHVGKGSVWVVVKIMGTYYHKPFMPSVSEGLIMQRPEHWIFKRVAFFLSPHFPLLEPDPQAVAPQPKLTAPYHIKTAFVECMEENNTGSERALFVKSASLLRYLCQVSELVPEYEKIRFWGREMP